MFKMFSGLLLLTIFSQLCLNPVGAVITHIHVVYFAYIQGMSYGVNTTEADLWLIRSQLEDLQATGILDRKNVILHCQVSSALVDTHEGALWRLHAVKSIVDSVVTQRVHFTGYLGNTFEYAGISKVWRIAMGLSHEEAHSTLIYYFHTKGSWHGGVSFYENKFKKYFFYFNTTMTPWRRVVDLFHEDPKLKAAGHAASPIGEMWVNFYWARASYVQKLEQPLVKSGGSGESDR